MKIQPFSLILLLNFGCISESNLKPIIPMQIIHSNSAKVWVLESEIVNNEEKTPKTRDFKTAFIFYNDGEFIEQKMTHLGSSKGRHGVYHLTISADSKDTIFGLRYKNRENKSFNLKKCSSKELLLQRSLTDDSTSSSYWTLKTLPKPFEWY